MNPSAFACIESSSTKPPFVEVHVTPVADAVTPAVSVVDQLRKKLETFHERPLSSWIPLLVKDGKHVVLDDGNTGRVGEPDTYVLFKRPNTKRKPGSSSSKSRPSKRASKGSPKRILPAAIPVENKQLVNASTYRSLFGGVRTESLRPFLPSFKSESKVDKEIKYCLYVAEQNQRAGVGTECIVKSCRNPYAKGKHITISAKNFSKGFQSWFTLALVDSEYSEDGGKALIADIKHMCRAGVSDWNSWKGVAGATSRLSAAFKIAVHFIEGMSKNPAVPVTFADIMEREYKKTQVQMESDDEEEEAATDTETTKNKARNGQDSASAAEDDSEEEEEEDQDVAANDSEDIGIEE